MTEQLNLRPKHKPFDNRTEGVVRLSSPEDLVTAVVEDILTSILGGKATEALYSYLLKNFDFRRGDVATKPDLFCEAIDKVFGKGGTVIQRIITHNLLDNLDAEHGEICNGGLTLAIAELKKRALSRGPFVLPT